MKRFSTLFLALAAVSGGSILSAQTAPDPANSHTAPPAANMPQTEGPQGPGGFPGGPGGFPGGPGGGPRGKPRPANTQGAKRKWLNVPYATQSPEEKLDIYLPNEGQGPYPVILAVHGGGFTGGDKDSGEVDGPLTGLTRGYAVVSVNYRLAPGAVFPAAVQDLHAAVRFLRANAAKYQLNPAKIAVWGDSAGANLASMLGTTATVKKLQGLELGNAQQSSSVLAVVDWFGPTDFSTMDDFFVKQGGPVFMKHSPPDSSESRYMGFAVSADPLRTREADPETYVTEATPPFFIENGSRDPIVPQRDHTDFAVILTKAIGPEKVTHIVLDGAGHGGPMFETPENLDKVFHFLDTYMK